MEHVSKEQLLLEDMQAIVALLKESKRTDLVIIQALSIAMDAIERLTPETIGTISEYGT